MSSAVFCFFVNGAGPISVPSNTAPSPTPLFDPHCATQGAFRWSPWVILLLRYLAAVCVIGALVLVPTVYDFRDASALAYFTIWTFIAWGVHGFLAAILSTQAMIRSMQDKPPLIVAVVPPPHVLANLSATPTAGGRPAPSGLLAGGAGAGAPGAAWQQPAGGKAVEYGAAPVAGPSSAAALPAPGGAGSVGAAPLQATASGTEGPAVPGAVPAAPKQGAKAAVGQKVRGSPKVGAAGAVGEATLEERQSLPQLPQCSAPSGAGPAAEGAKAAPCPAEGSSAEPGPGSLQLSWLRAPAVAGPVAESSTAGDRRGGEPQFSSLEAAAAWGASSTAEAGPRPTAQQGMATSVGTAAPFGGSAVGAPAGRLPPLASGGVPLAESSGSHHIVHVQDDKQPPPIALGGADVSADQQQQQWRQRSAHEQQLPRPTPVAATHHGGIAPRWTPLQKTVAITLQVGNCLSCGWYLYGGRAADVVFQYMWHCQVRRW